MAREPQREYQRIRQVRLFEDGLDLEPATLPELWTSNEVRRAIAHLFARHNGRPRPVICSENGGLLVGGRNDTKVVPISVDSLGKQYVRLFSIGSSHRDDRTSSADTALHVSDRNVRPTVGAHHEGDAADTITTVWDPTGVGCTHTVFARAYTNDALIYFRDPDSGNDQGGFILYAGEGWRKFPIRCSAIKIKNETPGSVASYVIEHMDYPYQ